LTRLTKHSLLTCLIAAVWLINGLFCKVLLLVPRHREIVARILGDAHAPLFTVLIGCSEILMAVWIFSRFRQKLNVITQIVLVAAMNILEFILAPDLLLWGRFNIVFALLLIAVIYYNQYVLNPRPNRLSVLPQNPIT
jgi:hypothetical protein